MGLTAREWLTVVLFMLTVVGGWLGFIARRILRTIDQHDEHLHGKDGLFRALSLYVKREDHDVANAELAAYMERLRIEANARESRIVEAIERQGERSAEENRILRAELVRVNERIDRIRDQGPVRRQ